jgi:uncharacterized delta-60 repeat protein
MNPDGTVRAEQKISDLAGGLTATLDTRTSSGGRSPGSATSTATAPPTSRRRAVDDDGGTNRGAVHILFMNPDGTVRAEQKISSTTGGLTAALDNSDQFGRSVAGSATSTATALPTSPSAPSSTTTTAPVARQPRRRPHPVHEPRRHRPRRTEDQRHPRRSHRHPRRQSTGSALRSPGSATSTATAPSASPSVLSETTTAAPTAAPSTSSTSADGDPEGIIWTGHNQGTYNGWFEYSLDGGTTWARYGWYRNGLLLRDTDRIRFVPTGFGAEGASITFRAWDQTLGSAGDVLRTYAFGGTAAISAATGTATITATAVNDAPVFGIPAQIGPGGSSDTVITVDLENRGESFNAVAETADGRIVAAGSISNDVLLARFNADGSVDTSFGDDGYVIQPIGTGTDIAYDVAIQTDGKIVVAGLTNSGTNDALVARFHADGTLDTTFGGGDGWTSVPSTTAQAWPSNPTATSSSPAPAGLALFAARVRHHRRPRCVVRLRWHRRPRRHQVRR